MFTRESNKTRLDPDDQAIAEMTEDQLVIVDCCARRVWLSETFMVDKSFNWCELCWSCEFGPGQS